VAIELKLVAIELRRVTIELRRVAKLLTDSLVLSQLALLQKSF